MRGVVNALFVVAALIVVGWDYLPDVQSQPLRQSPLTVAFEQSLRTDLLLIADQVGNKSIEEIAQAHERAFARAATQAEAVLLPSVEALAKDDYEGLRQLYRDAAEGLQ